MSLKNAAFIDCSENPKVTIPALIDMITEELTNDEHLSILIKALSARYYFKYDMEIFGNLISVFLATAGENPYDVKSKPEEHNAVNKELN